MSDQRPNERPVEVPAPEPDVDEDVCPNCEGSGVDPSDLGPVCGRCGGVGTVPTPRPEGG
jgi:hypothetical protein